jgi:hypothetical protein
MKSQNPFLSLITAMLTCFLICAVATVAFGVPNLALPFTAALILLGAIDKGNLKSALLMATPDTSALAAYAGKFEKALFSTLRQKLEIFNDITVIPGIKNALNLTKLTVKKGIRGYREDFDSDDGDLAYSGQKLSVELLKRDIKINPLKYRATWMSEVMAPGVNPADIPFAAFVWSAVMEQIAAEINEDSYLAVKGDMSTLAKSFDGLGTIIASAITAETAVPGTGIVPVATGEVTNTNAVAKFEQMTKAMPIQFRQNGFEHYVSYDMSDKYNEDYREKYKKYVSMNDDGTYFIDNTAKKVKIVPCSWMGTSQRIISTPKLNLLAGVDALGDMDTIHTDLELEIIKNRILFALGFQIRDLKAIKVNDQA